MMESASLLLRLSWITHRSHCCYRRQITQRKEYLERVGQTHSNPESSRDECRKQNQMSPAHQISQRADENDSCRIPGLAACWNLGGLLVADVKVGCEGIEDGLGVV